MSQVPWYVFALAASLLWGLQYALAEKVLQRFSPYFLYALVVVIFAALLPFTWKHLVAQSRDFLKFSDWMSFGALGVVFAGLAGTVLLYLAIQQHNASHVSLIEIAYPIFVVLFTCFLFGENHMNLYTTMGGLMILGGAFLVILKG